MHGDLFVCIARALEDHYVWFKPWRGAVGEISASHVSKCTTTMRVLAYGVSGDYVDEYNCNREDTIISSVKKFHIM